MDVLTPADIVFLALLTIGLWAALAHALSRSKILMKRDKNV